MVLVKGGGGVKHFLSTYHLPSWQGGDRTFPLCCKLRHGWGEGPPGAKLVTVEAEVTCPACQAALAKLPKPMAGKLGADAVMPRRPRHALHVRLVWEASQGMMFPFGVERRAAA